MQHSLINSYHSHSKSVSLTLPLLCDVKWCSKYTVHFNTTANITNILNLSQKNKYSDCVAQTIAPSAAPTTPEGEKAFYEDLDSMQYP